MVLSRCAPGLPVAAFFGLPGQNPPRHTFLDNDLTQQEKGITYMGLMDYLKTQFLEIIEWQDDSRDTISFRYPGQDKEIKNGAQLIVRESQVAQFVYLGQFGDTFGPGKYTLTTDNIPILSTLKGWKYGLHSPFKADVYFVNTRLFTGNKWGTANPIMMRDADFGIVRARAYGIFDFHVIDVKAVPQGSRRHRRSFPPRRIRRHHALAHRQRVHRRAGLGQSAGARRRLALPGTRRGAAAAHQSGGHDQIRPRDHELHRRKRLRAAGSRAGHRQAQQHGGGRQSQRLREIPDGRSP